MVNAALNSNGKQSITARLKTDAVSIVRLAADSSNGELMVTETLSGAITPATFAATDGNGRYSMFAVSENDSSVLIALAADSNGKLLIKKI